MNKKYFIFLGIILLVLALFSVNLFSSPIDLINVSFDKENYSMVYGDSLKINYTLENNNPEEQDILVYVMCDEDVLSCNFSKVFKLNELSSIYSSFNVKSIDDGSSNLRFYVKDMKTNDVKEYLLRIEVDRYNDEGRFQVDLSRTSYCADRAYESVLIFDRVNQNDFYNLSISSDTLISNIKGSNYRYLKNDTEVLLQIETRDVYPGNHTITLNISNDKVSSSKTFNVYVSECEDVLMPEFTVVGVMSTSHILKKEEPYTLTFTVKNISQKNKHLFISEESDDILKISFTNRELRLSPGESKEVSITFLAEKEISSGDYPVKLSFFDERTTINRNLRFLVQPESYLTYRLVQNTISFEIGNSFNLGVYVENKGDVSETIYFDFLLPNDLRINNMTESVRISPNTSNVYLFNISSGPNTLEMTSRVQLHVRNQSNSYSESFAIDVINFRSKEFLKIDFLSFPKEISLDANSSKDFSFEVYNFGNKDIVISKVDITGLSQEIDYEITQYITIPKNTSRMIHGKIIVGDISPQEFNSNIVFYSSSGSVITKPVLIKVTDVLVEYDDDEKGLFPITGFFTLSKSILLGIIFLALILIILFATGVIRTKHKSYVRN